MKKKFLVFLSIVSLLFEASVFSSGVSAEVADKKVSSPINSQSAKLLQGKTSVSVSDYNKISLNDAIDYALKHNLDLSGNRLNIDIAKNDIKVANRLQNPDFQSFFNIGKVWREEPNNFGLVLPVEIGKRGVRKKLAKSNLELVKGNVELAELQLKLDVRETYVDLVASKSILKILDEQKKLFSDLYDIAQKKYQAGAVPETDVIQAKITLNQLLIQYNSANTDVYIARNRFNSLLNAKDFDSKEDYLPSYKDSIKMLTPSPRCKLPDFNSIVEIALQKRIDLQNSLKEIDVAQKNLKVVIRQRIPDIELGAGRQFMTRNSTEDWKSETGGYIAGNITNIPLFYQYTPEIKNAKIAVDQKQLAYDSLRVKVVNDVNSSYDRFITAKDNLNYYTDNMMTESEQFLKMSKRSYEVGKTNITNLIYIEQSYKSIVTGYVTALAEYNDAWVDFLREVNDEDFNLGGQDI